MAKKMLIDATHAEETRVVVVDGNKVEEFDFESENKRQLAGNIYLAKVTRVEPSLQAAFVDYGGNRHGFLAFSEIHPDYYQIPVADREALIAEELAYAKAQAEEEDKPKRSRRRRRSRSKAEKVTTDDAVETRDVSDAEASSLDVIEPEASEADALLVADVEEGTSPAFTVAETPVEEPEDGEAPADAAAETPAAEAAEEATEEATEETPEISEAETGASEGEDVAEAEADAENASDGDETEGDDEDDTPETAAEKDENIESVADDDTAEEIRPRSKPRPRRYKIQEVIKVRQILLVQVVKEERGNKGAALTTYLSLAGRYCVLMPNTARGGGISRKITNANDRKKLKEIAGEMEVPEGAGLIIRTAGAQRTKSEVKRDYDYLKRMWEQIRELTLQSVAPAKIYEEGDLIKRSIRDLYSKEIDEVIVEGETGYREAKDFMKMIMPTHAKNVKHYGDSLPLFARYQVESYLSSMFNPTVQLKSGGYIVIDVTEALVAVDVNSGRATKEGSIEETALKTNLEAAEEVARQARLRDLAGLIVIDFIDMEERKHNTAVEKRLKDRLKTDRARIQVGRISGFGLLEMSRQRLRPGMLEATTQPCPHCHGTGLIRSDDNMALTILRQLEEEGTRKRSREVLLKAPVAIVNYLMNMKREKIAQIEARYGLSIRIEADPFLISPDFSIERFKTATRVVPEAAAPVVSASADLMADYDEAEEASETVVDDETPTDEEAKPKKRRRRRRRRRGKGGENGENGENTEGTENAEEADARPDAPEASEGDTSEDAAKQVSADGDAPAEADAQSSETEEMPKRRRTRRKKAETEAETPAETADTAEASDTAKPADAEAAAEEEKPKKRRKRRTKAEIEADKAAEAAAKAEAAVEAPAEAEAAETAEEAKPKPKRAPRKRKTKAEKDAEAAAAAAASEDSVVAEAPAAAPAEAPAVETPANSAAEPTPETASEPVAEVATAPVADTPADPARPKRKGWWNRG